MATNRTSEGYVAISDWPDLSAMVDSFGTRSLAPSDRLAGRSVRLRLENGWVVDHAFVDAERMRWSIVDGDAAGQSGVESYTAIEVREEIFLVDFVKHEGRAAEDVTILLDLPRDRGVVAISDLFDRDGEVRGKTAFLQASVGDAEPQPLERSSALVGKRVLYSYSDNDRYEHIYLNAGTFTWHCISGAEAGMADTEETRTWTVEEDLHLFFWTEAIMPVEAVLVIDLAHMRSVGRMFGWDGGPDQLVHLPFSSKATLLNDTVFPES